MKERPILFKDEMVRAILEGRKTQTRRVMKQQLMALTSDGLPFIQTADDERFGRLGKVIACPYGQPGDRIVVEETFYAWGRWETRFSAKKGRYELHFIDMTLESGKSYRYAVDHVGDSGPRERGGITPQWWKRPAIFMARHASRITLEITGVRVERLQDISEADARAEGAPPSHPSIDCVSREFGYSDFSRSWFAQLWESINGPGSWDANPWVWVVEFKRVQP